MLFPFDIIEPNEQIYIVDFHMDNINDWYKLIDITNNVIIIDHHKTAVEDMEGQSYEGIIKSGTKAGCWLTWEWFHGDDSKVPDIVQYISDHDTWTFAKGEDTEFVTSGIMLYDHGVKSIEWERWLDPSYSPSDEREKGIIALEYRRSLLDSWARKQTYFMEWEGIKFAVINTQPTGSKIFDVIRDDYDFDAMICYYFNGGRHIVSLYTELDIDLTPIAKKYGGGGHAKACGFQTVMLPWLHLDDVELELIRDKPKNKNKDGENGTTID